MPKGKKQGLSQRERKFCCHYVNSGNVEESASIAGYKVDPQSVGERLLVRNDVNALIEKMYAQKKKNLPYRAYSGYERLAFGNITDAIRLLYSDGAPEIRSITKMDLFNISEIKRPRDGSMEIKFFDRIRALEKLQQMDFPDSNSNLSFYNALEMGVKSFQGTVEE